MVYIVGIGPGSREYILPAAVETLKRSDVILGFIRAIESVDFIEAKKQVEQSLSEILRYITENNDKIISIVASGDPCFYGISDYIKKNYNGEIKIISGISSFQYLCSKLNKSWSNAYLSSLHGREEEFLEKVKENKTSIWLTDKKNSPNNLCSKLLNERIDARVYIGENLSYEDEKISIGNPEEFINDEFSELTVIIIENSRS
ncbi:MAG: precorrin-6y C5,15-methyltransferase (decarboxylating) subunit CbiE [Clostridiaceae bacterium]